MIECPTCRGNAALLNGFDCSRCAGAGMLTCDCGNCAGGETFGFSPLADLGIAEGVCKSVRPATAAEVNEFQNALMDAMRDARDYYDAA